MMGSNPVASKFSGLNNTGITNRVFMYSGIMAAIGGLIMLANYNSAKPDYGSAYTLQCILIVVLGGVNPNGGFGKIGGVTVAILILQVLSSGLNLFQNISNFYRPLIWGTVLLLVLSLNYFSQLNETKKIARQSNKEC
jgi:simple sugar transport system permease protein